MASGCKKEMAPNESLPAKDHNVSDKSNIAAGSFKERMIALRIKFPEGFVNKITANFTHRLNTSFHDQALRALGLAESTCDDNTELNQFLNKELEDWTEDDFSFAFDFLLLDLPFYYSWFFETNAGIQTFGSKGEYTQVVTKTFKDLKRFWNIETADMIVSGAHGRTLADAGKISNTLKVLFGFDQSTADMFGEYVSGIVKTNPPYRAGNHPIFTFNAVAIPTVDDIPTIGTIAHKILMGDGIMDAYAALGYNDVAPQAILAHEFGHQVQLQKGLFEDVNSPEATRRTELMADAFSAYYLSHARGAAMQWKRVQQFLQVFFDIGDCAFDNVNHHGTPTQRMQAAQWGYHLANNAQKQGHILSGEAFAALFDAALPGIVEKPIK
jgi:hypothetical protein